MKTKWRTGVSALTVVVLAAAASGCGLWSGSAEPDPGKPADPSPAPGDSAAAREPLGKYDPPIDITTVRAFDDSFKFVEGESLDDNIVLKLYREDMGIVWKNQWSAKNYVEKLNLAIASKNLPDIFMVDAGQLKELSEAGLLEDLTAIYEQYATPPVKESLGYQNGIGLKMGTFKGKLYGLPETRDTAGKGNLLWIRKDWLDRLGLAVPKTIDDVIAVAKAFAANDPDRNGQAKDTLGLMATNGLFDSSGLGALDGFAAAYGAYPGKWVRTASGDLGYGSVQPEVKTVLEKAHELYASGALNKEFALKDGGKANEDVIAGKLGMFYAPFWAPYWPIKDALTKDPTADWIVVPPPSGPSGEIGVPEVQFTFHWFVVRKGFKHPEAIVKALNYWYDLSLENGSRYAKFSELDQGKYKGMGLGNYSTLYISPPDISMKNADQLLSAHKSGDPSKLTPSAKKIWEDMKIPGVEGWTHQKVWLDAAPIVKRIKPNVVVDEFYGAPTKTMAEKSAALGKLINETFTKIIMGDKPIGEFDAMVAKWKEIGGDQVTKEVNEWAKSR
ncbi:extracellular solute-binding protein [Paenibacillus flagellatus]|uniref:ABC transporter substrate-binding protein n=1 Tax=Paenibacillus flagellatus TaxID=2211139 RepID=A0A2V5KBD7_9BACL|nr:extracellular solute-binding protein [Paenibacillus flagellatus]PYI56252.1 hypothetical protein DLM86_04505 [Paenibacillus flagellatus]